ncbi:MAG TPA: hypothetical protein PKE26_10945 [Kiritimatiellia bacterium]|nr:hypothetical protein [Kiritimatiellia bacterium]HMO99615.1 hypothetical protein [Kiritimatiellia bacterium]HMP96714.1 hypothetical protein [Kiritimatiellia bacterium]
MRMIIAILTLGLLTAWSASAQETNANWSFEITQYAWLVGPDADVKVGPRSGSIDVGFRDLIDYTDFAAGLLVVAKKNKWGVWMQTDGIFLDSDNDVTKFDDFGTLKSDLVIVQAGVGYQFDSPIRKCAILDVLLGFRYTSLDLRWRPADGGGSLSEGVDLFDPMIILRPHFPITERLAFNPTLGIGGGNDADLIYVLNPQFQFQFTDLIIGRLGYRRLYYDVSGDKASFDGTLHGFMVGVGVTF